MTIKCVSAVTLAVTDMDRSIKFYNKAGLDMIYGGSDSEFTSFQAGDSFINLISIEHYTYNWWGRLIFRVCDVDSLFKSFSNMGLNPEKPQDGNWGERFFHMRDPDGHEISFAQLIRGN